MSQNSQPRSSAGFRLAHLWPRLVHIYEREIWQSAYLRDRSIKGSFYAVLRIVSITVTVFMESRIATRAAALSFSSLLGLGPLIAIAVLVAGFAIGDNDNPGKVADTLNNMLKVVAPQIGEYEVLTQRDVPSSSEAAPPSATDSEKSVIVEVSPQVDPNLVDIINNIIIASKSGSAGALGIFSLLLIVLLLFKAIEDTFNDIWGVRQGRSVVTRIVFYWTTLTLGAILFFTSVALLSASTFVPVFAEKLPGGAELLKLTLWLLPVFSFTMLTVMLMVFYRVIPNTRVFWRAAFYGALVVAALLVLNNFVAFLYVKRVYMQRSLYGGLALPLVIMSGLYIFWLCVLTGGIVSYAIQNVHFRNSQAAWSTLTHSMRERLELVVFLSICRRFRDCLPPISASHLSTMLKVPTQLLNECLNRLVQLKLVTILRADVDAAEAEDLYHPARPLNRITLYDFKTLDENFGEDPIGASLERIDPLLSLYETALNKLSENEFFQKTVEELFNEHPFDESRPPFAMGAPRLKAQT